MEYSAPETVVRGTLITSAASAFVTGLYGISTRHPNYGLLFGAAAVNSGVTAFTFFSIREFAISPFLVYTLPWPQYARRRQLLGIEGSSDQDLVEQPSWSDLRKHKTLDTGLSGILTGGLLRGWKSGPRAVLPGALTAGAVCTMLQVAYNEFGVFRLKYVSRHTNDHPPPEKRSPTPPATIVPQKPLLERILITLGLQPVSDEEYLTKLKKTRDGHLRRIEELERQLEAEKTEEPSRA